MSTRTDQQRIVNEALRQARRVFGGGGSGAVTDLSPGTLGEGEVVANVGGVLTGVSPSAPGLHHTAHQNGGADEINVAGLSGVLADPQPPIIGSGGTQAVAGNDPRLADARPPTLHAASHGFGGGDEIDVGGLHGLLADPQTPAAHIHTAVSDLPAALITDVELAGELIDYVDYSTFDAHAAQHQNGGSDEMSVAGLSGVLADPQPPIIGSGAAQAVAGNDARLTDARTPTAHATTHKSGGSDAIKLDELAAPTDVTALNATTAQHGLLPKLGGGTTNFLRADGTWSAPPGGGTPSAHATTHENGGSDEINVTGLSGQLADPQPPIIGATGTTAVAGNDARLTDARTPLAHSHAESDITNLVTDLAAKAPIGVLKSIQVFSTAGAITWNRPAGCSSVRFRLIAGGGAGGSSAGAASSAGFAGGGGSGGYAEKVVNAPAASYNGSVGAAGAAGAAGNTVGGNGGDTTLTIGATTLTAKGGAGGSGSGAAAATALAVLGGAGGVLGTNGEVNTPGTPGDPGLRSSGTIGMSGNGGRGPLGGGGLGRIAAGAGAVGGNFGAGGGGAASIAAGNNAGGAGGVGCIIAEEFG